MSATRQLRRAFFNDMKVGVVPALQVQVELSHLCICKTRSNIYQQQHFRAWPCPVSGLTEVFVLVVTASARSHLHLPGW